MKSRSAASKPGWVTEKILGDLLAFFDIAATVTSALLAYYLYHFLINRGPVDSMNYAVIIVIAAAVFYTVARQRRQYDLQHPFDFANQLASLIYISAATVAATFAVLFFMKVPADISRIWVLLWAGLLMTFLAAGRALFNHYIELLMRKGLLRRSVVLIGSGSQFDTAKAALQRDQRHFSLVSALNFPAPSDSLKSGFSADLIYSLIKEAQDKQIHEVIIAVPASMGQDLESIVQQVQMLPVDVRVIPDFGGAKIPIMQVNSIAGLSVVTTVSKPISEWGAFLKAAEDCCIGLLCLILFAPAMALIAAAVKLDSKGPIFFRQRRHGYNHRVIEVVKFRTMTVLEDGDVIRQASKVDNRVTRVGAFLRRTSLDELPQLWNVIRGEMSIVGPRPHALAHNSYYGNLIENYANRHRVKPGLTGWAQIHGFRGETGDPEKMVMRVRYDLEYIDNWSVWLDLKIIIMTPLFGLFRRAAY